MDWDHDYDVDPTEYGVDDVDIGLLVEGSLVHETDLAYLWNTKAQGEQWIPKSQTLQIEPNFIQITDWVADQKGWTELINKGPNERPIVGYAQQHNFEDDDIPF